MLFVGFFKAFNSIHRGKMEQILIAYGHPKKLSQPLWYYIKTKVKVHSPSGDPDYYDIIAGVLQRDTLAPYLFIVSLEYMLRTSIDLIIKPF